jgi:hypothetical protein
MTAPAAARATEHLAPASSGVPSGRGIPNINPLTGLSTDYLNHFTEAVMALEMAGTMPECLEDLRAWRPKSYVEHFATSRFASRGAVIATYLAADPAVRDALDSAAETLNAVLTETRDVLLSHLVTPEANELAPRAVSWLKPLIARMAAVINGTKPKAIDCQDPQAAIDAIFAP